VWEKGACAERRGVEKCRGGERGERKREDIKIKILPEYRDYADIFSQQKINALPEHSKYDHHINLIPEAKLPDGPIYPLSKKELDALWDYIKEMEDHGKIRRSSSPIGAPILFVPKPDGTLRLCVDY